MNEQAERVIAKILGKLNPVNKEKKVIVTYNDLKKLTKKLKP